MSQGPLNLPLLVMVGLLLPAATGPPTPGRSDSTTRPVAPTHATFSPESAEELLPNQPITFSLTAAAPGFIGFYDTWRIQMERHATFSLIPDRTSIHTVTALCETSGVGIALFEDNGALIDFSTFDEGRRSRSVLHAALTGGERYWVVVGGKADLDDLRVRLLLSPEGSPSLRPDPLREATDLRDVIDKQEGVQHGVISDEDGIFEGRRADFIRVRRARQTWLRLRAASTSFDPVLYALDSQDRIVTINHDSVDGKLGAEIVLSPDDDIYTIVICEYFPAALGNYVIRVSEHPYKPNSFFSWAEYRMRSPLLTFVLGLVTSSVLSWFFYQKSIRSRIIRIEKRADDLIVDDRDIEHPTLQLRDGQKDLRCASQCKIRVWHAGHARIEKTQVREPLKLTLGNVISILSVRAETTPNSGWSNPTLGAEPGSELILDFDRLDSGDNLVVSAICEQSKPGPIEPVLTGDIAGTDIQTRTPMLPRVVLAFIITLTAFLLFIVVPVCLADMWLDFLPSSLRLSIVVFVLFNAWLSFAFILLTKLGRDLIASLFFSIVVSARNVVSVRRSGQSGLDPSEAARDHETRSYW